MNKKYKISLKSFLYISSKTINNEESKYFIFKSYATTKNNNTLSKSPKDGFLNSKKPIYGIYHPILLNIWSIKTYK